MRVAQLDLAEVKLRAAELFPPGAAVPAVKPRLPAVAQERTNELASVAFDASKGVKLIRGVLAREEAAGHIAADLLGIELLKEEALRLGESVRKAALAFKDADTQLKNGTSALKSKLKQKAAKDPVVRARLDGDVQRLDSELAVARAELLQAEPTLNGLPPANSIVVERRAPPAPAPPVRPAPAPRPAPRPMCERARDRLDMAQTEDGVLAIGTAYYLAKCKHERCDSYYIEDIDMAEVKYKHALRRLKRDYPGEFCGLSESSWGEMVGWTVRMHALGLPIPAADRAAERLEMCMKPAAIRWLLQHEACGKCEERGDTGPEGCMCAYTHPSGKY